MLNRRRVAALAGATVAAACGVVGMISGARASVGLASGHALAVVADDLDNPRGLFIDATGTLWVAEAGRRGRCIFSGFVCYGRTGRILRIAGGRSRVFARRLASLRTDLGTTGADDVSVSPDGTVFTAIINDEGLLPRRIRKRALNGQLGKLLRFGTAGRPAVVANLAVSGRFSHPYGVLALPGRELVTDSEQNTLIEVRGDRARVIFRFPQGAHGADSVPTSLAEGADGSIFIGELSGIDAGRSHARIWRMLPGDRPRVYAMGFNAIVGLAVGPDNSLYVCEFSRNFARNDPRGDIVRVAPDGTRTKFGVGRLFHPGGVAIGTDGSIYVSNWSTLGGKTNRAGHRGQIVRITP